MKKYISNIIIVLGLVLAAATAYAVTVHEATGKGAFVDRNGNVNSVQFKAGVDSTGTVFGETQDVISLPGTNLKFHGNVTCFVFTSPNTAEFGGVITSSSDPSLVGMFYVVEVIEDDPDQIGIEITKTAPTCIHQHVLTEPLLRGDLHVF
jgi:hypothetical protein